MQAPAFNVHLDHIARNLAQGKAVVVIGAGFSKNAQPKQRLVGGCLPPMPMPDWEGLIKLMAEELHPGDEDGRDRCLKSGALQVAQQFEANRGRPALDDFIKNVLSQVRFEPGHLHRQLLDLPWADVLTFNYDSLLENSSEDYHSGRYKTIYKSDNLLGACRPRIIKLHGSLPAGPFVITEEDFRTYPQKNPAFVNTARQLMIENTLVLMGFSGNDPNFKQIHGWVRDLFDQSSHRVYLCHVNAFNLSEVKLFHDAYKIELLNLADFAPSGGDVSHAVCLEEFFSQLKERCQTKPPEPAMSGLPDWLADISLDFYAPESAKRLFPKGTIQVDALWKEWSRQRKSYPGWLVAPLEIRNKISSHTDFWPDFLKSAAKSAPLEEELRVLWELWWRWDLCLEVVPRSWSDWVDDVIGRAGEAHNLPVPARKVLLHLRLFSIRNRREDMDAAGFTQALKNLEGQRETDVELDAQLLHEECLFALHNHDFDCLDLAVQRFQLIKSRGAIHDLRKIGWLAELGMIEEAKIIATRLMDEIGKQLVEVNAFDIAILSYEGWALFFHRIIHQTRRQDLMTEAPDYQSRWRDLRQVECDPWERLNELQNPLKSAAHQKPRKEEVAGFDPGVTTRTMTYASTLRECDSQALQYLRLFDHLGLPHHPGNLRVAADAMVKACQLIMPMAFKWSVTTRIRNDDKTLLEEMGRGFVLRLSDENASWLIKLCLRGLDQLLKRLPETALDVYDHYSGRYISYLLQLVSRLTLRMVPTQLEQMFALLCSYREHAGFQNAFMKWDAWGEALRRVLFSASKEQLSFWLPVLARMPFAPPTPHDGTMLPLSLEPFASVEKARIFDDKINLQASNDDISQWLEGLRSKIPGMRCAAFKRLFYNLNAKEWNDACVASFEDALWSVVDQDGLPSSTNYFALTFLNFPERTSQNAKILLRTRLLREAIPPIHGKAEDGSKMYSSQKAINYLIDLANSAIQLWLSTKKNSSKIEFDCVETGQLLQRAFSWWNDSHKILEQQLQNGDTLWLNPRDLLDAFQDALAYGVIPASCSASQVEPLDLERLEQMILSMNDMGYTAPTLEVATFMAGGLSFDHLVRSISNGLLSANEYEVSAAAHALEFWASWAWSNKGDREMPPPRLMVLLMDHVQYRMKPGLADVLAVCSRVVAAEWSCLEDVHFEALENGLRFLLVETAISPSQEGVWEIGDASHDALACKLRQRSALLAVRLSEYYSKEGKPIPEIISIWLDQAARDRLPEVRKVLWKTSVVALEP